MWDHDGPTDSKRGTDDPAVRLCGTITVPQLQNAERRRSRGSQTRNRGAQRFQPYVALLRHFKYCPTMFIHQYRVLIVWNRLTNSVKSTRTMSNTVPCSTKKKDGAAVRHTGAARASRFHVHDKLGPTAPFSTSASVLRSTPRFGSTPAELICGIGIFSQIFRPSLYKHNFVLKKWIFSKKNR